MVDSLIYLLIFAGLLTIGYVVGRATERRHFASIREREDKFAHVPVTTWDADEWPANVQRAQMATGSVVVSIDYFKRFMATLRALVGGEVRAYSPLLDRGRREAILRMKEQLPHADEFANLRIETSNVAATLPGNKNTLGSLEVVAYSTALFYRK